MGSWTVESDRVAPPGRSGRSFGAAGPAAPDALGVPAARVRGHPVEPSNRGGDDRWRMDEGGIRRVTVTMSREPTGSLGAMADGEADALRIDDRQKLVFVGGRRMRLSCKEFDLLRLLASDPGRVFSVGEILDALWPGRVRASGADVRQSVYQLRRRLETDARDPRWIVTARGFGYRLAVPVGR